MSFPRGTKPPTQKLPNTAHLMIASLLFDGLLVFAILTTTLIAGLLSSFAVLIMPGLGRLGDRGFLRSFQEIDAIIQRGHPIFITVWLGSIPSLLLVTAMGFYQLGSLAQALLITATVLYLAGVQATTLRGNIPLNNQLQALDLLAMSDSDLAKARQSFEPAWNRLNLFRTIICLSASILLIIVLLMR